MRMGDYVIMTTLEKVKMITYPKPLKKGSTIAICAPSGGVSVHMHKYLKKAKTHLEKKGYEIEEGETIWNLDKCVSAPKEERAKELQSFLLDDSIDAIIPPKGGSFLMEILPLLNWTKLKKSKPKWMLGHSDISTLLFAYTLQTGYATAHGANYLQLSSFESDPLTNKCFDILSASALSSINQVSSSYHRLLRPQQQTPKLDEAFAKPTEWKLLSNASNQIRQNSSFSGRLIGGCLNTLSILVGTPFAPLEEFSNKYCHEEGFIWYFESFKRDAANIYRELWQMKMKGWFEHTNGVLIGRPYYCTDTDDFLLTDAYHKIFDDLNIPVIYDVDIGHVPPQLTLVNGAFATVDFSNGKGTVDMTLK